jgi:hypothetical protein
MMKSYSFGLSYGAEPYKKSDLMSLTSIVSKHFILFTFLLELSSANLRDKTCRLRHLLSIGGHLLLAVTLPGV